MSNGKFQQLLESYGMLTTQQRLFYPRNFKLSEQFVAMLKKEMESQIKAGLEPDEFARKLSKALQFYITDYKKAHKAKRVSSDQQALN